MSYMTKNLKWSNIMLLQFRRAKESNILGRQKNLVPKILQPYIACHSKPFDLRPYYAYSIAL